MGAFKLGKMTFGSLFKKPETVLYPIESKPQPAGLKGHIALDAQSCILCGMCDRSCPTSCITVDKAASAWKINRYSCIQCGYCVTVCPKKCLMMEPGYAPAATQIAEDVVEVPKQAAADKKPAKEEPEAKPSAESGTPAESKPAASEREAAATLKAIDHVLEAKIALMDPAKAEKVREALSLSR